MPSQRANVKNEKQYEALKEKGMSKQRAARIANSPGPPVVGVESPALAGTPSKGERRPNTRLRDAREVVPRRDLSCDRSPEP